MENKIFFFYVEIFHRQGAEIKSGLGLSSTFIKVKKIKKHY